MNEAVAGQRTAVNVAGASVEELTRGMVLSPPATFESTKRLDVSLLLLQSAKPLKQRARVHFHCHTMECIAEVFLHGEKQLTPGGDAFAQLRLADETLLLPGDRFIIRQFSPVMTIGGGIVLDNAPPLKVWKKAAHLDFLNVLKKGSPADVLGARVMRAGTRGMSIADAVAQTGCRREEIITALSAIPNIVQIGESLISVSAIEQITAAIVSTLNTFHQQNHLVSGMSKEELREHLPVPALIFDALLDQASRSKQVGLPETSFACRVAA